MPVASERMTTDTAEVTIDEILSVLQGEEFEEFTRVMSIVQEVLDDPSKFVGSQALIAAAQLASLRTKFGTRAQYYKTTPDKSMVTRRRKDLCMTIYSALEENINSLKLLGRIEAGMQGGWN